MDMDSGQPVPNLPHPGKRKRSSNANLLTIQRTSSQDSEGKGSTPSDSERTRAIIKRSKRTTAASEPEFGEDGPSIAQIASCFPLPPFPVEILQRTMSYLDPFSLGRLMCVNKYLCGLLDPHSPSITSSGTTKLPVLKSEFIWSCSRRAHLPGTPHPLESVTELGMLRLIYGKRCQKCDMLPKVPAVGLSATLWNSGPGPTGTRTIWPFKTRLCADCLKPLLIKDTDLTGPGYSELQVGLLSASFTPSLHYVMSITLTQTPTPSGLKLEKYYYRPDVDSMMRSAPPRQSSTYQNWLQQLDASRQEAITDIVRVEAWELSTKSYRENLMVPPNRSSRSSASGSSIHSDNITRSHFTTSSGGFRPPLSSRSGLGTSITSGSLVRHDMAPQMLPHHEPSTTIAQPIPSIANFGQQPPANTVYQKSPFRIEQGSEYIKRLKAEKQADIFRRCIALDPPINASDLDRLPAYASAVQDLMPLNETSWELLKTQLLSQRQAQEVNLVPNQDVRSHADIMDTGSIWRSATPLPEPIEIDLKKQALRPVREKLYEFAREYVHRRYADGFGQTYSTAPQFAADVLTYVRQRFYENQKQEDAAFIATGQQPPDETASGIRTRILRLEHMRYVFESSIKPYTEMVRKDLFLCNSCDTQGRHFAFEAIIQHFASKHTDNFSRGNAVVYWKAEWPADPPFEPSPGRDVDLAGSLSQLGSTAQLSQQEVSMHDYDHLASATASNDPLAQPQSRSELPAYYNPEDTGGYVSPADRPRQESRLRPVNQVVDTGQPFPPSHYDKRLPEQFENLRDTHYHPMYGLPGIERIRSNTIRIHEPEARSTAHLLPEHMRIASERDTDNQHAPHTGYNRYTRAPRGDHEITGQRMLASSLYDDNNPHWRLQPPHDTSTVLLSPGGSEERSSSRPRSLVYGQHGYESPHARSRVVSTTHPRSRSTHQATSSYSDAQPRTAAQQFLDSFDPITASEYDKELSRSASVGQPLRPVSRDENARNEPAANRRSNMSQLLRRPQGTDDTNDTQHVIERDPAHTPLQYREPVRENPYLIIDRPRNVDSRYSTYSGTHDSNDERHFAWSIAQEPRHINMQIANYPVNRVDPEYHRLSRYDEYNGREAVFVEPQPLYIEERRYREVERQQPHVGEHRHSAPYQHESLYRRQQEPIWDPETRTYYFERPIREYISTARIIEQEDSPLRTATHPYDHEHYRQNPRRPTRDAPDFDPH